MLDVTTTPAAGRDAPVRVLAFPGSLRAASLNRLVVHSLPALAPAGMVIECFDRIGDLPLYNEDLDGPTPPDLVVDLRERVSAADALFWAMPEYNHTIPSVIKNAIEWISHPVSEAVLVGKISAIAVATQGRGGYRGMADLARVLRDLGGHVVAAPEVCIHFAHKVIVRDEDGAIRYEDPLAEKLLRLQLAAVEAAVRCDAGASSGAPWRAIFASMAKG